MPTIQTSYVGMPQEDADVLVEALAALGIFEYTKFWQGCVDALLVHHTRGDMIAWPPAFALQDREPEYVEIKLKLAKRFLEEQEQLKTTKGKPKSKKTQ